MAITTTWCPTNDDHTACEAPDRNNAGLAVRGANIFELVDWAGKDRFRRTKIKASFE